MKPFIPLAASFVILTLGGATYALSQTDDTGQDLPDHIEQCWVMEGKDGTDVKYEVPCPP